MRPLNDRYTIGTCIGRGGVGEVYEGRQVALDRPVAIKVLRDALTQNAAATARFEREARTAGLLNHPNIVTVYDVDRSLDGARFVVMERLHGRTLAERLEGGALPVAEALEIGWQIVRGMGAGQGVGLVHRDLKPENVFLTDSGHVKVLDFGLATLLERPEPPPERPASPEEAAAQLQMSPRITRPGALLGTPRYMAPEQVLGWGVDHRTDLYAFGVILYELLAGTTPFTGPQARDFMRQHLHQPPPSLGSVAPAVPPGLCAIVHRLLEKSPSDRFTDWADLAEALRRAEPSAPPSAGTVAAPAPPTNPTPPSELEALPAEPYRFLHPFTAATSTIFFGRDRDAARFRALWEEPDAAPLLVLTGASGVGKTSFLAARVIPGLEDTGHRVLRVRGGAHPLEALAQQAARLLRHAEGASLTVLCDALQAAEGRPVALVVDQAEEVLTAGSPADVRAFQAGLAALLGVGRQRVRVLLSLREDFLGPLLRALDPLPVDGLARTLPLRPLDGADIAEALAGPGRPGLPVRYRPFTFERGLLDEIVDDLLADGSGEVAPRAQAVGARLWEMVARDADPLVIRRLHYRDRLGGARGILARILDEAVAGFSPADQGVAKELLRALTHLPGSPTSRPAPEHELVGLAVDAERRRAILRRLEDRWRVIQGFAEPRWPGERVYRIAHEALIGRIQEYGEEGSERNRARQVLFQGLGLWLQGGRRDEDLLSEPHVELVQRHLNELVLRGPEARTFFERSLQRHNDGWMRRLQEQRRAELRRGVQLTLLPASLMLAGFLVGQALAGFVSLRVAGVHLLSALSVPRANLVGSHLREADLRGLRLRGARLDGSDLRDTKLDGANLEQASLLDVELAGARLDGADLRGAIVRAARAVDASFRDADLRQASLAGDLDGARFDGAIFDTSTTLAGRTRLDGALGPDGHAPGLVAAGLDRGPLDLSRLVAPGADLSQAVLDDSSLTEADLTEARLDGARLSRARLGGAVLRRASLRGVTLTGSSARSADFRGADLRDAHLSGTDFTGARFDGAALCGARLDGAVIESASFQGATTCPGTVFPSASPPPGLAAP